MQKRCESMRVDFQREESASHCVEYYIDQLQRELFVLNVMLVLLQANVVNNIYIKQVTT